MANNDVFLMYFNFDILKKIKDISIINIFSNQKNIYNNINELFDKKKYIYLKNPDDTIYILYYLLNNKYKFTNNKVLKNGMFKCFITETKEVYHIKVKANNKYINFINAKKIINNIKNISTKQAVELLKKIILKNGIKTTAGNIAYENLIKSIKNNKYYYPQLAIKTNEFCRKSTMGGYCYLNEKFSNKKIDNINIYDINSLYPFVLATKKTPYGKPIFYKGCYKKDDIYNTYIQHIIVDFEIKKDGIPFIYNNKDFIFYNGEYLKSTNGQLMELYLTEVDFNLFYQNYDIKDIYFIDGYMFKSSNKLFTKYVNEIYDKKVKSKIKDDKISCEYYKIMLNSAIGKFGSKREFINYKPILENNKIVYKENQKSINNTISYTPLNSFVCAWGRYIIINKIKEYKDYVIYSDTDSLHLHKIKIKSDKYKLGEFKEEYIDVAGKYIKSKTYIIKKLDFEKKVIAGATEDVKKNINIDNFKKGGIYKGNKKKKIKEGGIVDYEELSFKIL